MIRNTPVAGHREPARMSRRPTIFTGVSRVPMPTARGSAVPASLLAVLILSAAIAGCAQGGAAMISPNDPEYGRTGAPRAGEAPIDPNNNYYGRIMGRDSSGSDR